MTVNVAVPGMSNQCSLKTREMPTVTRRAPVPCPSSTTSSSNCTSTTSSTSHITSSYPSSSIFHTSSSSRIPSSSSISSSSSSTQILSSSSSFPSSFSSSHTLCSKMLSPSLSFTSSTLSCSLLHQRILLYLLLLFVLRVSAVSGVQVHRVKVPALAVVGKSAQLECVWVAGDRGFYSVRWYKNEEQFYSYVPKNSPQIKVDHNLRGVNVVLSKSNEFVVTLQEVRLDSEGKYRCEVMAESPTFETSFASNNLTVVVMPKTPRIFGLREKYTVGDELNVTCIVRDARPNALLTFHINGELVPIPKDHIQTMDGTYPGVRTSVARFQHVVTSRHRPSITLNCSYHVLSLSDYTSLTAKVNRQPTLSFFNTGATGEPPGALLLLLPAVSLITHLLTTSCRCCCCCYCC